MNVQVTEVNATRKTLTITLDPSEVDAQYNAILGEISRQVSLPGFRPGKAPAAMVAKRFAKELAEEFKGKVVGKAYRDAIEQSKIEVVSLVKVDEGTIQQGTSAAITITVDVQPEVKLPDYSTLTTEVKPTDPTDAEVDAAIEGMRAEKADYKAADRAAQKGDYVRFGYEGTLDGKPLAEIVGDKGIYAKAPQTWEEVEGQHEGLLPGLAGQLAGVKSGDRKQVTLTFPAEFAAVPALAGKAVSYALEIQEVRERVLPALDAEFLKGHQVETVDALKERIRADLRMRKEYENRSAQRRQVTDALVAQADFAVPESLVESERDGVLRQFIEENMRRGTPAEEFEKNKKELFESATRAAQGRVKMQMVLAKVAEQEKLRVEERDLNSWLMREAMRNGQRPDKVAKDLGKDRDYLRSVQQQILFDKALDFLVSKATVKQLASQA